MQNAVVRCDRLASTLGVDLFERGNDKRHWAEGFGARGNLLSRRVAKSRLLETPQSLQQIDKKLGAERTAALFRFPVISLRFGIPYTDPIEAGNSRLRDFRKTA